MRKNQQEIEKERESETDRERELSRRNFSLWWATDAILITKIIVSCINLVAAPAASPSYAAITRLPSLCCQRGAWLVDDC